MRTAIGGTPERVALISIDVINGFCASGALANPRVSRIARPVAVCFAAPTRSACATLR
ncbi:MAG: hypothetical protein U0Z44_07420 [Kouleothrix sp.]